MPRINVSDEELKLLERVRVKNAHTLGYNEGLEIAAIQFETGAIFNERISNVQPDDAQKVATHLRSLKRDLPL